MKPDMNSYSNIYPSVKFKQIPRIATESYQETRAYGDWIDDLIRRYLTYINSPDVKYENFLADCVFFNTVTFDRDEINRRKVQLGLGWDDTSVELDDFQHLYSWVNEKLYGKRWTREALRFQIPMAVVALDYEGTRYATKLEGKPKNAHLHVIWVVQPREISSFRALFRGPEFKLRILDKLAVDEFEIEPYDSGKTNIRKLSTYAAKTLNRTRRDPIANELLRIYPNRNYGPEPYRAAHRYTTRRKRFEKVRSAAIREAKYSGRRNGGTKGDAAI